MAAPEGKKRGLEHLDEYEPKPAKHLRSLHDRMSERRLVVILERASLETVKVKRSGLCLCDVVVQPPLPACVNEMCDCNIFSSNWLNDKQFCLCVVFQVGKTFELLNCDQHKNIIVKSGRNPGDIRPDITHQVNTSCVSHSYCFFI